jgi:hypothetical protein
LEAVGEDITGCFPLYFSKRNKLSIPFWKKLDLSAFMKACTNIVVEETSDELSFMRVSDA